MNIPIAASSTGGGVGNVLIIGNGQVEIAGGGV